VKQDRKERFVGEDRDAIARNGPVLKVDVSIAKT
jgi:hypothetical protein